MMRSALRRLALTSSFTKAITPRPLITSTTTPSRRLPQLALSSTVHARTMADFTHINSSEAAPALGPYSHAIKTPSAIYLSGSIPCDAQGNLVEGTIGDKTAAVFKNIKAVLEAADSSIERIVKVTIFLTDMANFADVNTEYAKWIQHKPARSCVAVKQLPKNVDVEIEVIALP
ncbi:Rid family detoxifying hydrolase [Microdochium nivale]|nr:Rid family detoxifying hydrolase [Microdochium nivale]